MPLTLGLFLPESWLEDSKLLDMTSGPADQRRALSNGEIALELLDAVRTETVQPCPGCAWTTRATGAAARHAQDCHEGLTLRARRHRGDARPCPQEPHCQAPGPSRRAWPHLHPHLEADSLRP